MVNKKVQDQVEQILRKEACFLYAAMTEDEAQRRYGAFCEAINRFVQEYQEACLPIRWLKSVLR